MIIVDKELEKRHEEGNPVRVAVVGAGFMGRGIALQIITGVEGMKVVAISNRSISEASRAYKEAGIDALQTVETISQLEEYISKDQYVITDNAMLLCQADGIDAIVEATGEVDFGAQVTVKAIEHGKHVILANAELDATLGPILKVYADRAGVVITNTDGDEPGVAMNLFRFVKTIGCKPVIAGNIKGFIDYYRTPETQREFAEKHNQKPYKITSFADGTKLSMETCVLANATGFKVAKRGMHGYKCDHVMDILKHFEPNEVLERGLVDYALGAAPGNGAFVVGYDDHPLRRQYMSYFKMGDGPLFLFYTPFHLPSVQLPLSVARAVLFQDATVEPLGAPYCDVVSIAKRDLKKGEKLDGIGGFTCYGLIDNVEVSQQDNLLPMGLSDGCQLTRNVQKDQEITYADVDLPKNRFSDKLRSEQNNYFS